MSLARIRDEERVPARLGATVRYETLTGVIVGCTDYDYVTVRFPHTRNLFHFHPRTLEYPKGE